MKREIKTASAADMPLVDMRQGHPGIEGIHAGNLDTNAMAALIVAMTPGQTGHCHTHPHESIVFYLEGFGVTIYGENCDVIPHRSGDWVLIPPGVPHLPATLSPTCGFVAYTVRANPDPTEDMHMRPDLDNAARPRIEQARKQFTSGTLPVSWAWTPDRGYQGGDSFVLRRHDHPTGRKNEGPS